MACRGKACRGEAKQGKGIVAGQILRPYQERGISQLLSGWKAGARSILCVSPVGSGKTTLFTYLAAQLEQAGQRTLILVHRRELAQQACNRLREFEVDFGLILSSEPSKPYAKVQVASVQTLIRRKAPPASLVICDEAHLSTAKTWTTLLERYPHSRILGVTATPWRLSGKPLAGQYDAHVVVTTPRELREQGSLCPYVGFSYKSPDMSDVKVKAGEFDENQTASKMSVSVIVDSVIEEYGKHARDLSTIVYAVTVEHSKQLAARFVAAGVAAEHLDGSTSIDARKATLARVQSGKTMVLVNCGLFIEGLDIPRLKCCIDAAPTKSLARAIQRWGRVRRPWNGIVARIHDHSFNVKSHGLPDDDRDYSLDAKPERPPALSTCSECLALFTGNVCPSCSHENEPQIVGERELNIIPDAEQYSFSSAETSEASKPVDVKWNNPGRVVEGTYIKQWEEQTSYGKQKRYLIRSEKRDYSLPGTVMLNAMMAQIAKGSLVQVTFTGEKDLGKGKTRKEFRVAVDDGAMVQP